MIRERMRLLRASQNAGLTMVELLIYSLLLAMVLGIVGSFLISSLTTEKTVRGVIDATTDGQLAARSVENGIRNASKFKLTTLTSKDQVLLARVANRTSAGGYNCQAWYYDYSEGEIRYKKQAALIPETAWTGHLSEWTVLLDDVVSAEGKPADAPIFEELGTKLSINFRVLAGDDPPAAISSSAVRRLTQESTQCF